MQDRPRVRRLALEVCGIVQGVGFRPFVYNLAMERKLIGWVVNESDRVRIEVEGPSDSVDRFVDTLSKRCPPQARIDRLEIREIPCREPELSDQSRFVIRESERGASPRPTVPADMATCAECLAEFSDKSERRFRYPFTNCTNCGPRWTIIQSLPYDRPRTSMTTFKMCEACRREYEDPRDRRFHAQPIACPDCGPKMRLIASNGVPLYDGDAAVVAASEAIRSGRVVAVKGLGGFQLLVDATNDDAVVRLRRRKQRPDKPFAVMLAGLDEVRAHCQLSDLEARELGSPRTPIMLLRRLCAGERPSTISPSVAPGNPYLGVMVPYTPLHDLLLNQVNRPIVCTSGNRSEEPMAVNTSEAVDRLGDIADVILTHNRPIVRPVDDSVARDDRGQIQLLRRARGYAPIPITLDRSPPTILAVGGHLKNVVALSIGRDVVLSPHIGDLDNSLSLDVHRRAISDLVNFFDVTPQVVACDMHPDYSSTRHAEQLAGEWNVPLIAVQHHHAHVLSAMAEHQLRGPLLGFAWDGTGYGPDGTVWGGEAIRVDGPTWARTAHLRTFPLPGGDQTAREPRRAALGLLYEYLAEACATTIDNWFSPSELSLLVSALERGTLFPRSSSMGRLFDAVAALCGLPVRVSFEGQAAMGLEFLVNRSETAAYPLPVSEAETAVIDWQPLVEGVLADLSNGLSQGRIAAKFHNALAGVAVSIARRTDCGRVVLSGGCFQNRWLADRTRLCLSEAGFEVYTQSVVPPGDGGIALGQVLGAALQVGE